MRMYLDERVEHEDEACGDEEGAEELEVVASLGRPERVAGQADDHHQRYRRRLKDHDPYFIIS